MERKVIGIKEKLPVIDSLLLSLPRVYSVWVIRGAAILAILFSCIGKVSATISTIPTPVMGGITLLLYGVIAVQAILIMVE